MEPPPARSAISTRHGGVFWRCCARVLIKSSWQVFSDAVRPLIRIDDEKDPVTKLARALLTLNDYVNEDREQRLETLAIFAAFAADKVGQDEVDKTLANLRQSAPPGQPEANADFRTGTSALGSGELEVELASVPPGDGGIGGEAGLAEDG